MDNSDLMDLSIETDSDCESDSDTVVSCDSAICMKRKPIKNSPLKPSELLSYAAKLKQIIVIKAADISYQLALDDMKGCSVISIVVEPSFNGIHSDLAIMAISTMTSVYIFDLTLPGMIFAELSNMLQAESPNKIMHYSHRICGLLYHRHKIVVAGIRDTFVAWCRAHHERRLITLDDALSEAFHLPLSELICDELTGEAQRSFSTRPLTHGQLKYLASLAILQEKLYDRLSFENLCGDVQRMSLEFSSVFYKTEDSEELALAMHPASTAGFDCIHID